MATAVTVGVPALEGAQEHASARAARIPWTIWCSVASVASVTIGGYWDISWHMSIGRDSFWTPPHLLIYFCGVLAGITSGYLILATTFGRDPQLLAASVSVWGFRAPLGAFIAAWGGITMLVSAPFDNWWHSAYGLDVKIFSPPHMALDLGVLTVAVGGLVLIRGAMNRAAAPLRRKLNWLFLYIGAMIVSVGLTAIWENTYRVFMHTARCYLAIAIVIPLLLVGLARASGSRWAGTALAAIYSAYALVLMWILPLFPAAPKLGPVYQKITHFVPMEFPMLLIVPAFALDLLWPRVKGWNRWAQAVAGGALFLLVLVAVQWPFAKFLLSPYSRNWFFGTNYFAYFQPPTSWGVLHKFVTIEHNASLFGWRMAMALVAAIVGTRVGFGWGEWVREVRR
ncbi:MAG: hypothetical protein ACLQOO_25045 [Terriglobia bacterium]